VIPVAQLDSSSLALWVNFEALARSPNLELYRGVLEAAATGDESASRQAIRQARTRPAFVRAVHLSSVIWHEQRHFLDLIATNYGARRFRTHLSLYQNLWPIVAEQKLTAKAPLLIPLTLHRGLPPSAGGVPAAPLVEQQIDDILLRRRHLIEDVFTLPSPRGSIPVSGEAALEGLAFLAQHWSVLSVAGGDTALDVLRDLPPRLHRSPSYEWPLLLALYLNLGTSKELTAYPFIDGARFIAAVLFASLAAPYLDTDRSKNGIAGVTERLVTLLHHSRDGIARELRGSSFIDSLAAVDDICRRTWGRTVLQELETDVAREQDLLSRLKKRRDDVGADAVADFFEQYHGNRVRIVEALQSGKWDLVDPTNAPTAYGALPTLPTPVYALPNGPYGVPPEGYVTLFGGTSTAGPRGRAIEFTWAYVPEQWPPSPEAIAFVRDRSWMDVLKLHAPASKLLLNGFRHRTMLGPELEAALAQLREAIEVRVGVQFSYSPVEDSDVDQFFFLSEQSSVSCDACDRPVTVDTGRLVSPAEVRSDPASIDAARWLYTRGDFPTEEQRQAIAEDDFARDWSYWILCEVCVDLLRPQRASARDDAAHYRDLAEDLREDPSGVAAALLAEGFACQREGRFEHAANYYEKALVAEDDQVAPTAAFSLGVVRAALGNDSGAEAAYRLAIENRWPQPSAKAAFNLGNLLTDDGDLEGAADAYSRATDLNDDEVTSVAWVALGRTERRRGKDDAALAAFDAVLATAEGDAVSAQEAALSIGELRADRNERAESFAALEAAMVGPDAELATQAALTVYIHAHTWGDYVKMEQARERISAHGDMSVVQRLLETLSAQSDADG
jgi:tetratricopeptide (TPR) repeat protein